MQWRAGTVVGLLHAWPGACVYAVRLTGAPEGESVRALGYTGMVGVAEVGDEVLLNASALLRGLGTGGLAFVVAVTSRLPVDPEPMPGHIVKARYTPLQQMLLAVDEQDSPHHEVLAQADDLAGLPVVVADLHSALPAVLAGARAQWAAREGGGADRALRAVYVMTDGGALPLAFSRTVAGLREAGWLDASVTVGQTFGGDHEAVSLHTGLLAAKHVLDADLVVVTQGPGNVGTDTRWGFSGVAAAEALHAAHVLGGRPLAALRISGADPRERHIGISHHSRTAYGRACLAPAEVPLPDLQGHIDDADLLGRVAEQAAGLAAANPLLDVVTVDLGGLRQALTEAPVGLSTMGRGLDDDPAAFLGSAAAGRLAVSERPRGRRRR